MRGLVLAVVLAFAALPVQAQSITAGAWQGFLDHSRDYHASDDYHSFEFALYDAVSKAKTSDDGVTAFAAKMGIDRARAEDYSGLIVDTVVYLEDCDDCAFTPGTPLYDRAARLAVAEPTGALMIDLGRHLFRNDETLPGFMRLAWSHPKAAQIFLRMNDESEHSFFLAAAILRLPDDPAVMDHLYLPTLDEAWSGEADELNGWIPAAIEATETRLGDRPEAFSWRVDLASWGVEQELWLGRDNEAVARYRAYPPDVREEMVSRVACNRDAFRRRLAAALWLDGAHDEALEMIACRGADSEYHDLMVPVTADKDLFAIYAGGMMGDVSHDTPGWRTLTVNRLGAAGYAEMAAWLISQPLYERQTWTWTRRPAVLAPMRDLMPADVVARQLAWARRVADARSGLQAKIAAASSVHVTTTQLAPAWTEKPLPAGMTAWRDPNEDEDDGSSFSFRLLSAPDLPEVAGLPVDPDSVLRYEESGQDAAVVYESPDLDRPGISSAEGLWVAVRRGGSWGKPLYLGLQQRFPYVVTPASHLPLLNGDHLNLEVQVREVLQGPLSYPGMRLNYGRSADGVYLDISLAALAVDSDGDGMMDIAEARTGLKPNNPDSDGDGLNDATDPLPLTAFDAKADPRTARIAQAVLDALLGSGESAPKADGPPMFLVFDRDIFSGVSPAFRVLIYSPADLERFGRPRAALAPVTVSDLYWSLDGADTFVQWRSGGSGGSFQIHCDDAGCASYSLGEWVS